MNTVQQVQNMKQQQEIFHKENKNKYTLERKCSCCSRNITEKNVMFIGQNTLGVWFNCPHCDSTMLQPLNSCLKHNRRQRNNVFKL